MSPRTEHSKLNIFIADEQRSARHIVRTSLQGVNNTNFSEYRDFSTLYDDLSFSWPDLLILDFDLPGGDMCKMVRSLRHDDFGKNPFVPIIAMTWEAKFSTVSRIIDSGVDVVLLKPLATTSITKHVERLTTDRKLFVVTSDYIGPDRRNDGTRPNTGPLIEVPNTLQTKRNGDALNIVALQTWIAQELGTVNTARLRSNAGEIIRIFDLILPAYESRDIKKSTFTQLGRVKAITKDISRRINGGDYEHIADFCDNLIGLIHSIVASRTDPPKKDLLLIKPLCEAILTGIDADASDLSAARAISSQLSSSAIQELRT